MPQIIVNGLSFKGLILYVSLTQCNDMPLQEPVIPGCFLRARPIGLMQMIDQVLPIYQKYLLNSACHWRSILLNSFAWLGGKRWQDNCSMWWWSGISTPHYYQPASSSSPNWNPLLLWRLYPSKRLKYPSWQFWHRIFLTFMQTRRMRTKRWQWMSSCLRLWQLKPSSTPCTFQILLQLHNLTSKLIISRLR